MRNINIFLSACATAVLVLACQKSWSSELQSSLKLQGETLNFEISGQKNWDYDVKRLKQGNLTKVQLLVKGLSEQALKNIKNITNPFVTSVQVNPKAMDGFSTIEFTLKSDRIEAFDYLTDQPSKLIVDFYMSEEPLIPDAKIAKAKKSAKSEVATKKAVDRQPADVDYLRVSDQDGIETYVDQVDLKSGLFDGGDDRFKRFKMRDFEVSREAILKGLTNYYLHFPMLDQDYGFWKKMKQNTPEYEITSSKNDENKQARLIHTLHKKKRPLVLQQTAEWFEKKYPDSAYLESIYFMQGDSLVDLWRKENSTEPFEAAMRSYGKGLEKFPKSTLAERTSLSMGFHYIDKKDYLSAVRRLNKHIENPLYKGRISQEYARLGLAYGLSKLNKTEEAVKEITEVEKSSNDPLVKAEAAYRKADFYMDNGQYDEAVLSYEEALKKYDKFSPLFPNAYFNRMEALFRMKRPEQSHQVGLDFVQKFPSHEFAPYGLTRVGELLEIMGADQTKSVGAYLETHFRYGDSPKTIVARLHLLSTRMKSMKQQELDQTIQKMDELTKKSELENIDQFEISMIADGYIRRDSYEKAIDLLSQFFQTSPNRKDSYQITNRITKSVNDHIKFLSDHANHKEVLSVYQKYSDSWIKKQDRIDTDYFVAKAYQAAGAYHFAAKKYTSVKDRISKLGKDADSLFIKANQSLPQIDQVSLAQAICAFHDGRMQDSFQQLQSITKPDTLTESEQVDRVYLASQLYEKRGDVDAAVRYLTEIVRVWKGKPEIVASSALRLADLEAKKEHYEKSIAILQEMTTEKTPPDQQVRAYRMMSEIGLKSKNDKVAVQALSELLEKHEKTTPLSEERFRLGEIYYSQGDMKKAQDTWAEFKSPEGDFWSKLAQEKVKSAQWKDEYKKYLKRIPATAGEFNVNN